MHCSPVCPDLRRDREEQLKMMRNIAVHVCILSITLSHDTREQKYVHQKKEIVQFIKKKREEYMAFYIPLSTNTMPQY